MAAPRAIIMTAPTACVMRRAIIMATELDSAVNPLAIVKMANPDV